MMSDVVKKVELELYEKQYEIINIQEDIVKELLWIIVHHTEIELEELKDVTEKINHAAEIRKECG